MSNIILGCDVNNANDAKCQEAVKSALEKNGHTVEKLAISPSPFGNSGYQSKAKGKIGIYLMASSLVSVTDVASSGWQFKYTYFIIRGDASKLIQSQSDFESKKIPKDHHGDCTNSYCDKWQGKTYPEINKEITGKGQVIFGGSTPEEMANAIVSAMGGQTSDSSGDSGDDSGGSSGTVKECIQNLLKHWDGDVECVIKGKNVYINKVRSPESSYAGLLYEGVNVFSDNTTVTDVNPNTPNHLIVEWTGGTIEFRDEKLIARFGEKPRVMTAVRKKVVTYVEPSSSSSSDDGTDTTDTADEGNASDGAGAGEQGNTDTVDGFSFTL